MSEWRTIDSAPKDGSKVLVYKRGAIHIAYWSAIWHPDNLMWVIELPKRGGEPLCVESLGPDSNAWVGSPERDGPSHWMPLPSPPEDSQ